MPARVSGRPSRPPTTRPPAAGVSSRPGPRAAEPSATLPIAQRSLWAGRTGRCVTQAPLLDPHPRDPSFVSSRPWARRGLAKPLSCPLWALPPAPRTRLCTRLPAQQRAHVPLGCYPPRVASVSADAPSEREQAPPCGLCPSSGLHPSLMVGTRQRGAPGRGTGTLAQAKGVVSQEPSQATGSQHPSPAGSIGRVPEEDGGGGETPQSDDESPWPPAWRQTRPLGVTSTDPASPVG